MELSVAQLIEALNVSERILANPQVKSDSKEKAGEILGLLLGVMKDAIKGE